SGTVAAHSPRDPLPQSAWPGTPVVCGTQGGPPVTTRLMRWVGELVLRHPVLVLLFSAALTAVLYSHIHYLRMGTDLTDMFGRGNPEWRAVSQMGEELGYGNQLFVLVEAPPNQEGA